MTMGANHEHGCQHQVTVCLRLVEHILAYKAAIEVECKGATREFTTALRTALCKALT